MKGKIYKNKLNPDSQFRLRDFQHSQNSGVDQIHRSRSPDNLNHAQDIRSPFQKRVPIQNAEEVSEVEFQNSTATLCKGNLRIESPHQRLYTNSPCNNESEFHRFEKDQNSEIVRPKNLARVASSPNMLPFSSGKRRRVSNNMEERNVMNLLEDPIDEQGSQPSRMIMAHSSVSTKTAVENSPLGYPARSMVELLSPSSPHHPRESPQYQTGGLSQLNYGKDSIALKIGHKHSLNHKGKTDAVEKRFKERLQCIQKQHALESEHFAEQLQQKDRTIEELKEALEAKEALIRQLVEENSSISSRSHASFAARSQQAVVGI